jgi:CheY-like chemotaxis protein
VIDSRFDGPELSGEEIRELLRDDALGAEPVAEGPPGASRPSSGHVLLVSRRKDDLGLFRSRLEAHGASVTIVRNPFSALDQIRRAVFEGVVTDLGLWANDGELLLDRVRPRDSGLPLLFIADRLRDEDGRLRTRLRGAGAFDVVFRPYSAADVERAAAELVSAAEAPPAATSPPAQVPSEGTSRGEVRWLRFFFHAQRAARAPSDGTLRLRAILDAAREHLAASSCAFFVGGATGRFALIAGTPGGEPEALPGEVDARAAEVAKDSLVLRGEGTPGRSDGSGPAMTGPEGAGRRFTLVLGGLPEHVRLSSTSFLEDLRVLVADALSKAL